MIIFYDDQYHIYDIFLFYQNRRNYVMQLYHFNREWIMYDVLYQKIYQELNYSFILFIILIKN